MGGLPILIGFLILLILGGFTVIVLAAIGYFNGSSSNTIPTVVPTTTPTPVSSLESSMDTTEDD